ncbi:MAG: hypothetical protein KR126chlam1_01064 [Chlamydiae bacterium]|nr:hypothetical protein [Chlamydiota bacterium]
MRIVESPFPQQTIPSVHSPSLSQRAAPQERRDTFASLQSAKRQNPVGKFFYYAFLVPMRLIAQICAYVGRSLQSTICCCCKFRPPHSYRNWAADYNISSALVTALVNKQRHLGSAQEKLDENNKKLCPEARERLFRFIGCAIARETNPDLVGDRPGQEQWYLDNKDGKDGEKPIDIKHYFTLTGNDGLLLSALREFHEENARGAGLSPIIA